MAARCISLLYHCPNCKKDYRTAERVPACECGQDLHCQKWAVPGYKYCENHGGPAPSRNFYGKGRGPVSGTDSQFALTKLSSKYIQMQKDGRILSNRASIEVVRQRVGELLERLGKNMFPDQMLALRKLWREFRSVEGTLEAVKVRQELDEAFEAVFHDYAGWSQVFEALELDSKMVEREAKVAKDLHAILTAEDAYKLTAKLQAALIVSVQQEPRIPDEVKAHLLKRVEYEFTRIIGEGSGEGDFGSGGEIIDA